MKMGTCIIFVEICENMVLWLYANLCECALLANNVHMKTHIYVIINAQRDAKIKQCHNTMCFFHTFPCVINTHVLMWLSHYIFVKLFTLS